MGHAFGEKRLLGERLLKEGLGRFLRLLEESGIEHHADAGAPVRQRHIPEPAIGRTKLAGERAVAACISLDSVVVGEDRDLLEVRIGFLELEMVAQNRVASARIDHIAGRDLFKVAVLRLQIQLHSIFEKLDALDRGFLAHLGPVFGGVIEQQLVELRPRHLIRGIGLRAEAILEIEFHPFLRTGARHLAAVFPEETGLLEFLVQTEPGKRLHADREKRFADVKTREFSRSQTSTLRPARASRVAAVLPAGPPPMTATS